MSIRIYFAFLAAMLLLACAAPALGQSARARATAHVDLPARLKEVEGNPKLTQDLLKAGQKVAALVCGNCHGDGGNSVKPDIPNLAGQNPVYLLDQLHQFAQGQRRNEFMQGMINALTSDEKIGIVLFYSRQNVLGHTSNASPALTARGKDIYLKNCWRCHAADGRGNERFARIAGQHGAYLTTTLKLYRTGAGPRTNPLMVANTKLLTDADIEALAAYVATME